MEEEYTLTTGAKTALTVFSVLLICSSLFMFSVARPVEGPFIIIPLVFLAISAWIFLKAMRRKIITYDDRIVYIGSFYSRVLMLNEIQGYRLGDKVLTLESVSGAKSISMSFIDFRGADQFVNWVKANYADLNKEGLKDSQEEVFNRADLGSTKEEREKRFGKYKEIAIAYNIWGGVLGFFTIFLNGRFATILLIFYCFLGFVVILTSKRIIKFASDGSKSIYPFMWIGFFAPAASLFGQSVGNYSVLDISNLMLPALAISVISFACLATAGINRSIKPVGGQIVMMIIASVLLALGSLRLVNCQFDDSQGQQFEAQIADKWIARGKTTTYNIRLGAWGPSAGGEELTVSKDFYNNVNLGQPLHLKLKPGVLGMQWYYLIE